MTTVRSGEIPSARRTMNKAGRTPIVMVTGGTGWLGRGLIHALINGVQGVRLEADRICVLIPVDQPSQELTALGVEVVRGDLRDTGACEALVRDGAGGILLHMAGIIHPSGRTWMFDAVNHRGTVALYEAARKAEVKRFVAMSSNSPIGFNPDPNHLFTEDSPYRPYMGYGRSKWRMEIALRQAMAIHPLPEITIVRAPWFYGPFQPPRQTLFFSMVKEGRFPRVGD